MALDETITSERQPGWHKKGLNSVTNIRIRTRRSTNTKTPKIPHTHTNYMQLPVSRYPSISFLVFQVAALQKVFLTKLFTHSLSPKSSKLAQVMTFFTSVWNTSSVSNPIQNIDCPGGFRAFTWFFYTNIGAATSGRPRPLPSTSLPIYFY